MSINIGWNNLPSVGFRSESTYPRPRARMDTFRYADAQTQLAGSAPEPSRPPAQVTEGLHIPEMRLRTGMKRSALVNVTKQRNSSDEEEIIRSQERDAAGLILAGWNTLYNTAE
ncbi:unnamed protein product [Pleuronectes platessa]|uniref:Uncharacterized protein n=1 Tax=Pleuronectes platessa TaxID=8262 RepID=A0A9N7VWV6_PLEPL|nr:unnamed protein product [Pleuronectes platessa]